MILSLTLALVQPAPADQLKPGDHTRSIEVGKRMRMRTYLVHVPKSVEHSIRAWVKANGCKDEPEIVTLPDKARDEGGGHTWPGREPSLKYLGRSTRNIAANDVMWEFFRRYALK